MIYKSGLIASWVAIFGVMVFVFGEMDYANKTDPSHVETAQVAIRGVTIGPYRGP